MSELAAQAIRDARDQMWEEDPICSFCDKECKSADHLYIHIMLKHPKHEIFNFEPHPVFVAQDVIYTNPEVVKQLRIGDKTNAEKQEAVEAYFAGSKR